jgi:hypothetical protein
MGNDTPDVFVGHNRPVRGATVRPPRLLGDMNLLFLVHVTQEVDESANESDYRSRDRPPHVMGTRIFPRCSHKPIEIVDPKNQRGQTHDHGQYVFNLHLEPPANELLKVKEKALIVACMLTPPPGSRQALPHCLCPVSKPAFQNCAPIAFPSGNPLAVEEFE